MSTVEDKVNTWLQGAIRPSPVDKSSKKDHPAKKSAKTSNENMNKEGALRDAASKEYSKRRYFGCRNVNRLQTPPP